MSASPPNGRPSRPKAYAQALSMQAALLKDALDEETAPAARAQVARAWNELEERKRIMRMKPKPKDIDVSTTKHKPRKPIEPQELP